MPLTCGRISATWLALRRPGSSSVSGASPRPTVTTPTSGGAPPAFLPASSVFVQAASSRVARARGSRRRFGMAAHAASRMWRELEGLAPRRASIAGIAFGTRLPAPCAPDEPDPEHQTLCRRAEHRPGRGRGDGRGGAHQPEPRLPWLPERAGGEPAGAGPGQRDRRLPRSRAAGISCASPRSAGDRCCARACPRPRRRR